MGTLGAEVFENDSAIEAYLAEVGKLVRRIDDVVDNPDFEIEETESDLAIVHMLRVLGEHCRPIPLAAARLEAWKQRFLEVYDEEIDGLEPTDAYKKERRQVIVRAFDDLGRFVREPPKSGPKAGKKKK
jgi:hypothetical protein